MRSASFGCVCSLFRRTESSLRSGTTIISDPENLNSTTLSRSFTVKNEFLRFLAPSDFLISGNFASPHRILGTRFGLGCLPAVRHLSTTATLNVEVSNVPNPVARKAASVVTDPKPFVCPFDGRAYRSQKLLDSHHKRRHAEGKISSAADSRSFDSPADLYRHHNQIHLDARRRDHVSPFSPSQMIRHSIRNDQEATQTSTEQNSTATAEFSEENNGDDLTKLFDLADVTFLFENKRIYYNRGFLAMHSPHFKRLFYGANASRDKEIRLKDEKFEDILTLLKLLKLRANSNEQLITDENVEDLLTLAAEYQLSQVTAECEKVLLIKWKFSKSKIVKAIELSAKFGLYNVRNELLVKPADDYPALLTDENVEQLLSIAKDYRLVDLTDLCLKFLLQNWKNADDKVALVVKLVAKFGLEKAFANLLKSKDAVQSGIMDDNVERLMRLSKAYSLFEIYANCEGHIMLNWRGKPEKALRAVEIAHEMKLPDVAKSFIPLAARRPMQEIDRSANKLSSELYRAILRASFLREFERLGWTTFEFKYFKYVVMPVKTVLRVAKFDPVKMEVLRKCVDDAIELHKY